MRDPTPVALLALACILTAPSATIARRPPADPFLRQLLRHVAFAAGAQRQAADAASDPTDGATSATAGNCTVTITRPAAGDVFVAGTTETIRWTGTNLTGLADIDLFVGSQRHSFIPFSVPLSAGAVDWDICRPVGDATDYTIVIRPRDCSAGQTFSSQPFTITGSDPKPTVTITSGFAGQTFTAGSTQTITWSVTNPFGSFFVVSVQRSGRTVQSAGFVPMAAGRFEWTICPNIGDGTDYGIQLSTNECGVGVSVSDGEFTITGSTPPAEATLTAPAGGETFNAGGVATATWNATNASGSVLGLLTRGGQTVQFLNSAPTIDGRLDWAVCSMLEEAPDYAIRLLGRGCDDTIDVTSAPFAVTGSRPRPTFAITAPRGGRRFTAGTKQVITWTAQNPVGIVFATLERGGRRLFTVGSAPMAAGRLDWDICPFIGDGADYAMLLSTVVCRSSTSELSDTFEITGSGPQPAVVVTSPASGEALTAGTSHLIRWNATNAAGDVSLGLSSESRGLFASIGAAPMADGQFLWDICPGLGDATDVRITVLTSACGQQWEGEAFTITGSTAPPALTPTSPAGGETFLAGTRQTITWTAISPFGDLFASLERDGLAEAFIGLAAMVDGAMEWQIDPTLPTQSNYRIKLSAPGCPGVVAFGPFFSVEARRPGDVNGDRQVDLMMDHRLLVDCLMGPDVIADPACLTADFNGDVRVDLRDVGIAQTGYGNP